MVDSGPLRRQRKDYTGMIRREPTKTFRDGRQVHDLTTAEGRRRYAATLENAYQTQGHICPICKRFIAMEDLSPDHFRPKSLGRDDRPENIVAVHYFCNSAKGSRQNYYEKP